MERHCIWSVSYVVSLVNYGAVLVNVRRGRYRWPMSTSAKRTRRPSDEVRDLLLSAAREEFLAHGYDGTTTKEIARRAGVSETLIFNHYDDKAGLFSAALTAPFAELVDTYVAAWNDNVGTIDERITMLVDHLFELAREHRTILVSAVNHRLTHGPPVDDDILDRLAEQLQSIQSLAETSDVRRFNLDPPATIAVTAGMILGTVLLDDLLFPRKRRKPSRDRLKTELVTMLLHGIEHRGPDTPTHSPSPAVVGAKARD